MTFVVTFCRVIDRGAGSSCLCHDICRDVCVVIFVLSVHWLVVVLVVAPGRDTQVVRPFVGTFVVTNGRDVCLAIR